MDSERVSDFIRQYIPERDADIQSLREIAENTGVPVIRAETESFLKSILVLMKPRRILELGTGTGYSAIMMARTAEGYEPPLETIDTIEDWKPRISEARKNIEKTGYSGRIRLIEGDALEIMKTIEEPYDLIFIDAAKGQYPDYLREAMRLSHKGSVILADNIMQGGEILESKFTVTRRDRTIHKRLREYLDMVSSDEKLATTIIPIGDGITLSVRQR